MTVLDLISGAMRLFGALGAGETPNTDEQADGLAVLNDLLAEWSLDGANLYTTCTNVWPLTAAKQTYTLGPSGDWNGARPAFLEAAVLVQAATSLRFPLDASLTALEWAALRDRTVQGQAPEKLYCDYAFPVAHVSLWPVPSVTASVELVAWNALAAFAALTDTIALPPGYAKALRYALALQYAAEFGAQLDPVSQQIAVGARDTVRALNTQLGAIPARAPQAPPLAQQQQ